MTDLHGFLKLLIEGNDLSRVQAKGLLRLLMKDETSPSDNAEVLKALAGKGESVEEIVGFAEGMRELMLSVGGTDDAVDIVGTGGDGSNSFNISTCSALVVSGAGVKVAKHGNRAASSKCGSADVLEALGVNINLNPEKAEEVLKKVGMVFLFAPSFHPAMKKVGPVRKELKIRTIFNYLGPFLNPVGVRRMLLGVANLELARKFLEIAKQLNYEYLMIVSSNDGLDEISVADKTSVFELRNGEVLEFVIDPAKLGFKKYSKGDLVGGDPEMNAEIVRNILRGEEVGAKREAVVLNSAYALVVAGKVKDVKEGMQLAEEVIDSGKALSVLENLIKETNEKS